MWQSLRVGAGGGRGRGGERRVAGVAGGGARITSFDPLATRAPTQRSMCCSLGTEPHASSYSRRQWTGLGHEMRTSGRLHTGHCLPTDRLRVHSYSPLRFSCGTHVREHLRPHCRCHQAAQQQDQCHEQRPWGHEQRPWSRARPGRGTQYGLHSH
jgi:hypothetical protein